eukprot:SAG31_NODE_3367_length_4356_cov_1.707775_2_plen_454_part_00
MAAAGRASRSELEASASEFVSPVLGRMIENIMAQRPKDVAQYIVKYLTQKDSVASAAKHWDDMSKELVALKQAGHKNTAATTKPKSVKPEETASTAIPMETFAAICTALDPYEAQERIIAEACQLLKCYRASIFLADHDEGVLVLHVAKGTDSIRIPITSGIAGECCTSGAMITINDPYNDPRFNASADKKTGYTTTSILAAPVKDNTDETLAVLQAINKLDGGFTESDSDIVAKLSMLAGIALKNAQMMERIRASDKKTRSLVDVVKAVSSNHGLNSVIFTITQKCPSLVECEAATMYLIDVKRAQLWSVATDTGKEFRVPLKGTIAGFVGDTGKVVNIPDCYNDQATDEANSADGVIRRPPWAGHDFDKKTNFKTRNMLVLPIMIGGWNDFEPFNKEVFVVFYLLLMFCGHEISNFDERACSQVVGVLQLINKTPSKKDGFGEEDEEVLES